MARENMLSHLIKRYLTLLDQSDYRLFITLFYIIFMPISGSTYVNQPSFFMCFPNSGQGQPTRVNFMISKIFYPKPASSSSLCVQRFAFQVRFIFGRLRVLPIYKLLQHNNRHWGFNQQIGTPLEQSSTLKLYLLASAL